MNNKQNNSTMINFNTLNACCKFAQTQLQGTCSDARAVALEAHSRQLLKTDARRGYIPGLNGMEAVATVDVPMVGATVQIQRNVNRGTYHIVNIILD